MRCRGCGEGSDVVREFRVEQVPTGRQAFFQTGQEILGWPSGIQGYGTPATRPVGYYGPETAPRYSAVYADGRVVADPRAHEPAWRSGEHLCASCRDDALERRRRLVAECEAAERRVRECEQAVRDAEARFKDARDAPFGFRAPSPHAGPMRRRMHARRLARAQTERAPTLRPYSEAIARAKAARDAARDALHQLRIELMTADRAG